MSSSDMSVEIENLKRQVEDLSKTVNHLISTNTRITADFFAFKDDLWNHHHTAEFETILNNVKIVCTTSGPHRKD